MADVADPHVLAEREKLQAASQSIIAAVALTTLKIIVGLMTNSLGVLSEAAHSGLDLIAAIITWFAVRFSGRPADRSHLYGHGKFENLSALVQMLLLLATCAWIILEAVERLGDKHETVNATSWAFGVMGISIIVDYTRSRMLLRVSRKYNSQALEADALHFRTDIWSSLVVIVGLLGVRLGGILPAHASWLHKADAVAALGVAMLVIVVSVRLGRRTVAALLDAAPAGVDVQIKELVESLPRVIDCHRIRVRSSGPRLFVDVHVLMDGNETLHRAHELTETIERKIQEMHPNADITVHPEPYSNESDDQDQGRRNSTK